MKLESEKHFLTNLRLFRDTVLYVVATYHKKETFLGNNYNQKPEKKIKINVTSFKKRIRKLVNLHFCVKIE